MLNKTALALVASSLVLGAAAVSPANANYDRCYEEPFAKGCPGNYDVSQEPFYVAPSKSATPSRPIPAPHGPQEGESLSVSDNTKRPRQSESLSRPMPSNTPDTLVSPSKHSAHTCLNHSIRGTLNEEKNSGTFQRFQRGRP